MRVFSKLLPKLTWKQLLSGVGMIALIAFSGLMVFETTKTEVTLTENGEEQSIKTHADTVEELLAESGITYEEQDAINHKLNTPVKNGMNITYDEANEVTVKVDGDEKRYYTTTDTVGELLKDEGIQLTKHDNMSLDKDASVEDGMTIAIDKAFQVTVNDGGDKERVWTNGGTVEHLLNEQEIELNKLDKIKPAKDKKVKKDTPVIITRIKKVTEEVKAPIDYQVEKREDSSLAKGKRHVIAKGKEGLVVKEYEVTKENGKEINRELIDKTVKRKSESRIVAIGTKVSEQNLTTLSDKSSSDKSGKVMYMNATAYSSNCSGCSGITATGINLNKNPNKKIVSVDTSVIPLGTKVWIEGYGTAIAADTGSHIVGNRIDLHFPSRSSALNFGRKTVKVKVLD
ncbi:G5 and 3D domain-containing protein [Lentibacillus cibarius]|uniref:DUF348 domain-containing protein n=1 Tax=Lentibacillus cibarius TaxID=2583219 RepID=A0A5S3QP56_9BACI|nr:G5 and 3D domain-containing protein [Lentibacillus cibarius]TMN22316.1 DUF348 domain-containing protein [Lentibacillus cibarius]